MADKKDKGLIFSGARARVSMSGTPLGFAVNVSGSEEYQYDPLEVLGNIEVSEHIPIAYRVTLSASQVWFVNESLKSQGLFPKGGASPEDRLRNVLSQADLNFLIEDSQTDETMGLFEQVRIANYNFSITARAIVARDINFVAIRYKDVSEV
jgi:hypothetical protein